MKRGPKTVSKPISSEPPVRSFTRLAVPPLRDRIAEILRKAILNGSLPEGSRIVERQLAAQFEISLTAVREALIRLEAEGFVVKKPNASTYVTKLSLERSEKIFKIRRVLESYAMEEAALNATPEQIQQLEKAYWEMVDAARNNNPESFILHDYALHELIWSMTGNEYVLAALQRITPPVFAFAAMRMSKGNAFDLLQDAQSHMPLLDAIKSNNPEKARTAFLAALDSWLASTRAHVFGSQTAKVPKLSPSRG
jgi:DNA-binding GntR family transcriptional regulator